MPKGKRLLQSKQIVNQVFNYFSEMEKRCAGRGPLNRTLEATGSWVLWCCTLVECCVCVGISKWAVKRIWREVNYGGPDFSSPEKWYKVSRWCVLVDTFDCEAIRRRMYQLYEEKENENPLKLLVMTLCQDFVSSIVESYNGAWNSALSTFTHHCYPLFCCFASHFVGKEEHCLKS